MIADATAPVPAAWWFAGACAALVLAGLARRAVAAAALCLAAVLFGAGWFTLRIHERPSRSLEAVLNGAMIGTDSTLRGLVLTVEGLVLEDPSPVEGDARGLERFIRREPSSRFAVDVRRVQTGDEWVGVSGRMRVRVGGESPPGVRAGSIARITGLARAVGERRNPGQSDPRRLAAQEGVVGSIAATSAELVARVDDNPRTWGESVRAGFLRARAWLRSRARAAVDAAVPPGGSWAGVGAERELVLGLLLGEIDRGGSDLQAQFARLGLLHVLSISGFHLAVLAGLTLWALRLTGDRGWVEPVVVGVIVVVYAMIVPASSPIARSAAMVVLLLAGEAMGRRYDRVTLLLWVACGLLVWRPMDLWSLGFQLTVGLTGLLLWQGSAFHARVFGERVRTNLPDAAPGPLKRAWEHARLAASSSVMCCLASVPAVLFRTGLLSPLAALATLAVSPIIVVVMWAGYAAMFVGAIAPSAAGWVGGVVRVPARLAVLAAGWIDAIPFSALRPPPVSVAWTLAATWAIVRLIRAPRGPRRGRARAALVLAALLLWLAAEWTLGGRLGRGVELRVDMLAVGDGSCFLVRSRDGALLWDAGSLSAGLGRAEIPRATRALGAWRVPTVIVTHPDIDHFGALPEIVGPLGVREVYTCGRFLDQAREKPLGAAACLLDELSRRGVAVRALSAGDDLHLGGATGRVLSPPADAGWSADNEHSLVMEFTPGSGGASLLMTGDTQDHAIGELIARFPDLHASVLELPHHGSARTIAMEWTRRVDPRVILQSTGAGRADDARWAGVRTGRAWYTTATDGACWAELLRDGSVRSGRTLTDHAGE